MFEINADAQSLDIEKLLAKIDTRDSTIESGKDPKKFILNGSVNLNIDHLAYKNYNFSPFKADIVISENQTAVNIIESKLCSIAIPGSIIVTPGEIKLHINPTASNNEFKPALQCTTQNKHYIMDGMFNLDGDLSAQGNPESLVESLNGPFNLKLSNGRIYKDHILARVLALVNVTEIFLGQYPDFQKEGFPYDEISFKATFKNGVLALDHYTLDSPSLETVCRGKINLVKETMDIVVLVAPVKTVSRVVKKIPLLRNVLSGTLFTIPIKIQGPFDNPNITPLSPMAVGEDLLNTMEEAIEAPVRIFQPLTKKP